MARRSVFLVGFSGSGKSTAGKMLAKKLKMPFVDTDRLIETEEKRSISEIFAESGESYFRGVERQIVDRLVTRTRPAVVSLGGGMFADKRNCKLLRASGVVVYLSCAARELYRRLREASDRPLMNVRPARGETEAAARQRRIRELLAQRLPYYSQAHLVVSTTTRSIPEVVSEVTQALKKYYATDQSTAG